MISVNDILRLPYTPDLTEGGIAYACRSLPYTYNRMGGSAAKRLQRIVGGVAVELALRRHLSRQNIPFDILGATPFTEPDRYDIALGGHRCDLKSFLITRREQIRGLHRDLRPLLQAPALVPLDQYASEAHSDDDLYLFAFLTALLATSPADLQKVLAARQPVYFIHTLPPTWARPHAWIPLGPLALKSEADETLSLELGGQNKERDFVTRTLELPGRRRVEVEADFHSLAYMHVVTRPAARLGIHSPARRETYLIPSAAWHNIWVYGMEIYLLGWMSHSEFRRRARLIAEGQPVFQYYRTRTKNLAVLVGELKPIPDLLERVVRWKAQGKG